MGPSLSGLDTQSLSLDRIELLDVLVAARVLGDESSLAQDGKIVVEAITRGELIDVGE